MHYTSRPYLDGILFFDPVWDKHHLCGCFASSGQIGEESEERQDAKIFGSTGGGRTSFWLNLKGSLSQLLDLKGSLQRSAAKRCFNGPLWSANNLGAMEKKVAWLVVVGRYNYNCNCTGSISFLFAMPQFFRVMKFAGFGNVFHAIEWMNDETPSCGLVKQGWLHCNQISTQCLFVPLYESSLIVLFTRSHSCEGADANLPKKK